MMARPDNLGALPFADYADPDPHGQLRIGDADAADDGPLAMHGWASVRNGKWHRTVSTEPTFVHDEESLCGLTFRPLNVEWRACGPSALPAYICKRCQP